MNNIIDEIKNKIDIVDFIGNFINLKKAGKNYKALCPFHTEKTPSFIVSPERQIWHCFGACNEGGDVIKFLMKWENITFYEALKELANKTGVSLNNVVFEDRLWKKKERFLNMNFLATEFFSFVLHNKKYGKNAMNYLFSRKVNLSTIKLFQIGYAPNSWSSLKNFLRKKNFTEEEMFENGLLIKNQKGDYYDRFRGRIIFPIKDSRGFVLGFSGRLINDNIKEAKYINSPETFIYHKRETLFGINLAKDSIRKENNVYIVEGEFDVILPYQYGFKNFVAIKGTALTKEQLILLKRYTNKITLNLDMDDAGIESTKKAIEEAERLDFDIRVVVLTSGKDSDEALKKDIKIFKEQIKKPESIYDFIIKTAFNRYPENNSESKKKVADFVLPFVEKIINPIVKNYYVKKIAKLLEVSEESIEKALKIIKTKYKNKNYSSIKIDKSKKEDREVLIEKYFLSYIFQSENPFALVDKFSSIVSGEDFYQPSYKKIFNILTEEKNRSKEFILNNFFKKLPSEIKTIFDEIYLFGSQEFIKRENIDKISLQLKKNSIKRQIKNILDNSDNKKENNNNQERLILLNKKLKEIEKNLIK